MADWWRVETAWHEAGHALVATRLGAVVRKVNMNPRGGDASAFVLTRDEERDPLRLMAFSLAGVLAQDIHTGCAQRNRVIAGGGHDLPVVRDDARAALARYRTGEQPGWNLRKNPTVLRIAEHAWRLSHATIMDDYGALVALAGELVEAKRVVYGPRVQEVIDGALRAPAPAHAVRTAVDFWPPWFQPRGWWVAPRGKRET